MIFVLIKSKAGNNPNTISSSTVRCSASEQGSSLSQAADTLDIHFKEEIGLFPKVMLAVLLLLCFQLFKSFPKPLRLNAVEH